MGRNITFLHISQKSSYSSDRSSVTSSTHGDMCWMSEADHGWHQAPIPPTVVLISAVDNSILTKAHLSMIIFTSYKRLEKPVSCPLTIPYILSTSQSLTATASISATSTMLYSTS